MSLPLFGAQIPISVLVAVLLLCALFIYQRKNITIPRIVWCLVIVMMIGLSQLIQDIYSMMSVYDLQRNWHYVTFAAYVIMYFYAFGVTEENKARRILGAFFSAFFLSLFDEFFQLKMASRVFDISDIAKDAWGAIMGLLFVFFVLETYGTIDFKKHKLLPKSIKDYKRNPLAALVLTGVFSLTLLLVSPLLTDHQYAGILLILWLLLFVVTMTLIYLLRSRSFRIIIASIIGIVIIGLAGSFLSHRNSNINYVADNLIVYKGIPIPYFDMLIYQDGSARLMDKKSFFNEKDMAYLKSHKPDIILIGNGFRSQRGNEIVANEGTLFIYNNFTNDITQLIVLNTPDACRLFNRMKQNKKDVLFVIHSTH
ncbi:MAG: VanZ family protein [Candidatus Electryoneaceae bacterium]|nr:VanZ family protein [Candidatus Electryoneaceae bacterium]